MIIRIAVIILALLGLIFVIGPYFNYAVFDSQCQTAGCSGQICSAKKLVSAGYSTTCEWKPEYGCNKDCEARDLKCSFDEESKSSCIKFLQDCETQTETRDLCVQKCYNSSQETGK